jgi:hypothetical protein
MDAVLGQRGMPVTLDPNKDMMFGPILDPRSGLARRLAQQ